MPALTRISDTSTGHSCFRPTVAIVGGAETCFANGLPAGISGIAFEPHTCGKTTHELESRTANEGSSTVFIEGKPAIRIGDLISCGDAVGQGSSNIFCN